MTRHPHLAADLERVARPGDVRVARPVTPRAVTRTRRAHRWWPLRQRVPARQMRPAYWRTPPPGRPLPPIKVTRPAPKRRGGQAQPMTAAQRDANYEHQAPGSRFVTPRQRRRLEHKENQQIARTLIRTQP